MSEFEPVFPFEFIVYGTPVSHQRENPKARLEWKELVRTAARTLLSEQFQFATNKRLSATLFYFPNDKMQGDVDNIIKLTLDAMSAYIYIDDAQIERVVVQKFEPGRLFSFSNPSETLLNCITGPKPALYIRLSDPHEGLV
ncbi:MAG: RusA family crossover junction endodeoxyribonuclease [Rhizomicrobium sp.]